MGNSELSMDRKLTDYIVSTNDDKVLVIDGSISTQCTKALNEVLKLKVDKVTGLALEYYGMPDITTGSRYVDAKAFIEKSKQNGKQCGLFYTIDTEQESMMDDIAFRTAIDIMDDKEKRNSALLIQGTMKPHSIANAVYNEAKSNSIQVFFDIDSAIKFYQKV